MKKTFSKHLSRLFSLVLIVCLVSSGILSGCASSDENTSNSTKATDSIASSEQNSDTKDNNSSDTSDNNDNQDSSNTSHITADGSYDFCIYDDDTVYTDDQKKIQQDFDKFLNELLVDEISSSYISIVSRVEHPENYGITIDEISYGDNSLESILEEDNTLNETLEALKGFDVSALNYEQKLIYDTVEAIITTNLKLSKYWYFSELFSPLSGIQCNLPINLSDIEFKNTTDIERYLLLIGDTKHLFDDCFEVERYRSSEYGLFLSSDAVEEVTNQCNDFINAKENILISNFKERIDTCTFLTDTEKKLYITKNNILVNSLVIPCFKELKEVLKELDGTRKYDSLSEYPHGDEYYEALVQSNTSSLKRIEELYTICEQYLVSSSDFFGTLSMNDQLKIRNIKYPTNDATTILNSMIDKLTIDFPEAVTTNYEVNMVPTSLESSTSLAYYMIPAIDNFEKNIIYINGKYADSDINGTLAHEGYPGHLYQHTYFASLNPNPVRYVLNNIGYTEGFAMYAENCAFSYYDFDQVVVDYLTNNNIYGYNLYSYIDLCVNYKGLSYDDINSFLASCGYDEEATKELYNIALNDPGVYLRYGLGLDLILELKETCKNLLGDKYTDKIFNKFLLEIGSTNFDIIKDRLKTFANELN